MESQDWLEQAWVDREETVFPPFFGPESPGIFTLSHLVFLETFKQPSFDPRWLHYGVFEFMPTTTRPSWLYVTSGMSNAWHDDIPRPEGPSGFGCEFVLETNKQGDWAILRLQHLRAFQILLEYGRFPDIQPLSLYDRVPLRSSITREPSDLRWLFLAPPVSFLQRFELASGWVDLYEVFGATEEEVTYAQMHGSEKLVEHLTLLGNFPITDPNQKSAVNAPD